MKCNSRSVLIWVLGVVLGAGLAAGGSALAEKPANTKKAEKAEKALPIEESPGLCRDLRSHQE